MPASPLGIRGAVITGWASALPPKIVTNHDLSKTLDTSDEWIRERSGIGERHIGGTTAELSIQSASAAMKMAGVDPLAIDALVLSTTTPDRCVPATSATVQHALGLKCGAFDVNAACSGFVYALTIAHGLIAMGANKVLVIGTDTLSRITDWSDRNTAVLFADGSGAVVLEAVDGPGQMLAWDIDADGSAEDALYADLGGFIKMEGKEVFRRAVRIMVDSAQKSLSAAGLTSEDIDVVIPHQANIRIIQAACDRLEIPIEKAATVLHYTGNTSSASVPLALDHAVRSGRVERGQLLLLEAFGGGFTWGSALLRY